MLSALVLAADAATPQAKPDAVVRTLAALVPAAIEGVLRDVTLAGAGGGDLAEIADHAGCDYCESDDPSRIVALAVARLRGPHVFVLRAGRAPDAGFIEEMGDFLARGDSARGALLRERPETIWSRLLPNLAPACGLVAPLAVLASSEARDFAALARAAKPALTLRARARRVD